MSEEEIKELKSLIKEYEICYKESKYEGNVEEYKGLKDTHKLLNNALNCIDKLQKELEQEKGKNKKLNLENQALFESINCNDDNMLARRYQKLQKELDNSNRVIETLKHSQDIKYKRLLKKYEDLKDMTSEEIKEIIYKKVEEEND